MVTKNETRRTIDPPIRRPWQTRALLGILIVGAIIRVALWVAWSEWSPLINDDARDYENLAARLVTTGTYSSERGERISLRPPGYPAAVSAIYEGFGLKNNDAVRAVQATLGLATTLLVYRIATIAYSRSVGLWAAAITCFYPPLLGYANLILSETLFTFLTTSFAWLICEAILRERIAILIAAGLLMGLAALTRSIMLLFVPIIGMMLLVGWRGNGSRRLLAAVLPLAAFTVVVLPWAIRNTRLQQTLTIIDVMGGRNAMMGNYEFTPMERSWATISDVPEEHQWYRVLQNERQSTVRLTQGQIDKLALRHAISFVTSHPWLTLKRDIVKFFNFWQLERVFVAAASGGYFGELSLAVKVLLTCILCGSYAAVLFLGIYGACCYTPEVKTYHWFFVASILFPCVIHTLIFAHSRYHLPIIPILAIYSAAAIVYRREIWNRRSSLRFRAASALCLLIALGWLRELVFVDSTSVKHLIG